MAKTLFTDYEGFVEKFKPKKTTDDCYTPPQIYNAIVDYVKMRVPDITESEILRPFYPGGDFEAVDYQPNHVVIDNPPFSIMSKIVKFYIKNKVRFFLFAPHLTLFTVPEKATKIVVGTSITYENGAKVATSFVTNMYGEGAIICDGELFKIIDAFNTPKAVQRKIKHPENVVSAALLSDIPKSGASVTFAADQIAKIAKYGTGYQIFGGGYLLSSKCTEAKAKAKAKAEAKAEEIPLSVKDLEIIKILDRAL